MSIAADHDLCVIEDAAQSVHAYYKGKALGGIGHLGCYSFDASKNYTSGEGGALCVNDDTLVERAEIFRDKGTNRRQFMRGQVDKYTWVDVGTASAPSELVSAFLFAQLEQLETLHESRRAVYEHYCHRLTPLHDAGLIRLPTIPDECESNFHVFAVLAVDVAVRNELLAHLNAAEISAIFHYVPLHTSPMGSKLVKPVSLPVTESVSERLVRLPLYSELARDQIDRVVDTIELFYFQ